MSKIILDACCGGRYCWFNKKHPNVLYIDNRKARKGHIKEQPNHLVEPDQLVDFRKMPFDDDSFSLILFDPPHMKEGVEGLMDKKYGTLNQETWRQDLRQGFDECWRVLKPNGTLIFKWSVCEIKLNEVLDCFSKTPLFGHTSGKTGKTKWMCFIKI
jgi:SAM-dependent methyltransferase